MILYIMPYSHANLLHIKLHFVPVKIISTQLSQLSFNYERNIYVNKYITLNRCWTYTAPTYMDHHNKLIV
jgi:hypothetical protein